MQKIDAASQHLLFNKRIMTGKERNRNFFSVDKI